MSEGQEAQIEAFLNNFTASNPAVAYTSTEVLKQYTDSVQNTVLLVGGMIAAIFALTVLENALNAPSMWYFTMHFTLAPALIVALVYVFLATVIPAIALHFFNNGTVVERLRTAE